MVIDAVIFEDDPNKEHRRIQEATADTARAAWELGARLLRFQQNGEWRNVTVGGPYSSFTDYLFVAPDAPAELVESLKLKARDVSAELGFQRLAFGRSEAGSALEIGFGAPDER